MVERRFRRYYIPAGGTLVALFIALQLWGLQIIDISGDVYCTDVCTSYFDVRNPTYRSIYIYNRNEIRMDFVPEIKNYQLYVKYYRKWVPMDFTMETRLGNVPKSRKFVFVFPRYSTKKFKLVGNKEDWQDIKWGFNMPSAELDLIWISGTQVGDKVVKELCEPKYKTWTEEIKHYKTCTNCYNTTIKSNETEGTLYPNGTYYLTKEICYNYNCLDYIEKIEHINEQVDCIKTGVVNVSGTIYQGDDSYCKLIGNKVCCAHNKEGGKYAAFWRTDGSVAKCCEDLITDKLICDNMIGKKLTDVINFE